MRRFGLDLCLGRMVSADNPEPVYVGRLGLTDSAGRRLLLDWRSQAAEPFFGATHANPMGLASRRRYRWTRGRISDYWDEVFTPDGLEGHAALDDQSAFIASLGSSRSTRMRDVPGRCPTCRSWTRHGSGSATRRRHDVSAGVTLRLPPNVSQMARVVDDLIEAADDEYGVGLVTMLRGEDFQDALADESALPGTDPDLLAGPFAHIVVDEAQ